MRQDSMNGMLNLSGGVYRNAIVSIPLSKKDHPDEVVLNHDRQGHYSMKSGYHVTRGVVRICVKFLICINSFS